MFKKILIFLLLLLILPLNACKKEEVNSTTEDLTLDETFEETFEELDPVHPSKEETEEPSLEPTIKETEEPSLEPTTEETEEPTIDLSHEYNMRDAKALCQKYQKTYKENFDKKIYVTVTGTLVMDFAVSGNYHFMLLADETDILPLLVSANKETLKKYQKGNSYTITGNPGYFRNSECLSISPLVYPTLNGKGQIDVRKFSKASDLNQVYDLAYKLEVIDNNSALDNQVLKVRATFLYKITDGLLLIYANNKPLIIHYTDKLNTVFKMGDVCDFYLMPTVSTGKKAAEYLASDKVSNNQDILTEVKNSAINCDIDKLSQTNRYNDEKALYPHIFKGNLYVSAFIIDEDTPYAKYRMAFVSDLNHDVKYQKNTNERPLAFFLKNHYLSGRDINYSNLVPYYETGVMGEFYFVICNYQSELHAFDAFVIDDLTKELK